MPQSATLITCADSTGKLQAGKGSTLGLSTLWSPKSELRGVPLSWLLVHSCSQSTQDVLKYL